MNSVHNLLDKLEEVKVKLTDKEYKGLTEALQGTFLEVEKLKEENKLKNLYSPHTIKYIKCNLESLFVAGDDIKGCVSLDICEYSHPFVRIDENSSVPVLEEDIGDLSAFKKLTFNSKKPNIIIPSDWIFANLTTECTEIVDRPGHYCASIKRIYCEKIFLLEVVACK